MTNGNMWTEPGDEEQEMAGFPFHHDLFDLIAPGINSPKSHLPPFRQIDKKQKLETVPYSVADVRNQAIFSIINLSNRFELSQDIIMNSALIYDRIPAGDANINIATALLISQKMEGNRFTSLCESLSAAFEQPLDVEAITKNELAVFSLFKFNVLTVSSLAFLRVINLDNRPEVTVLLKYALLAAITDIHCRDYYEEEIAIAAYSLISSILQIEQLQCEVNSQCLEFVKKRMIDVIQGTNSINERFAPAIDHIKQFISTLSQ